MESGVSVEPDCAFRCGVGPSYMPETVESSNLALSSFSVLRAVSRIADTTMAASRFL